jgi:hypothetical protein
MNHGQAIIEIGLRGVNGNGPLHLFKSLLAPAQLMQGNTKIIMRIRIPRQHLNNPLIISDRLLKPPHPVKYKPPIEHDLIIPGIQPQRHRVVMQCLLKAVVFAGLVAQGEQFLGLLDSVGGVAVGLEDGRVEGEGGRLLADRGLVLEQVAVQHLRGLGLGHRQPGGQRHPALESPGVVLDSPLEQAHPIIAARSLQQSLLAIPIPLQHEIQIQDSSLKGIAFLMAAGADIPGLGAPGVKFHQPVAICDCFLKHVLF